MERLLLPAPMRPREQLVSHRQGLRVQEQGPCPRVRAEGPRAVDVLRAGGGGVTLQSARDSSRATDKKTAQFKGTERGRGHW